MVCRMHLLFLWVVQGRPSFLVSCLSVGATTPLLVQGVLAVDAHVTLPLYHMGVGAADIALDSEL